jgi:type I restriction enzyme S subunit
MNNSPWPMVAIDNVTEMIKRPETPMPGVQYRQIGVRLWGVGAYEREVLDGAQTQYKELYRVEADDIIVNKIWARNGSVAVVTPELAGCYASGEFPLYAPDKTKLEPRWFHWITKTAFFWQLCDEKSHGTSGKNRIRPERFLEIEIPLPPLPEQHRIVARIETLAAKVDAARTLREQAMEEVEALFASAADTTFEPKPNWRIAKVGDFCEKPQYGYTESATRQPIGPRFLRITDIQNGQVNWESVPFCNCPDPEKYLLKENDILFARTGGTTGKSYLVKECPQTVFASYLIRLRVEKWVTPDYLYCYFQSPSYWKQVIDNKKGTGQPNVNGRKLAEIEVPVPPLPEQHRIVAHLDALQAKLTAVQQHQTATQARLDALLPSILDKAFKGEL